MYFSHLITTGTHSKHVKHGRGDRNSKPCALLCFKGIFFHVAPLSAIFTLKVIDNDNFLVCSERHDGGPLSWAEGRQPWFKGTWFHSFQYLLSGMANQFSTVCASFQVKLTTIHPFTVDTGLAKKPRSRLKLILKKIFASRIPWIAWVAS